jgi:uncharacterized protein (TIGR02171 family)
MIPVVLALLLLFSGCARELSSEPNPHSSDSKFQIEQSSQSQELLKLSELGFELIQANDQPIQIGPKDYNLTAQINYDFWISSTEFFDSLPDNPNTDLKPKVFVSWFDAIELCNQQSKKYGFEEVYYWTGIKRMPNGSIYEMEGLQFFPEKKGFRLPTQAEWNKVGDLAMKPVDATLIKAHSRVRENSNDSLWPVKSMPNDSAQMYDLFGNALEWVWDANFFPKNITLVNPIVGAGSLKLGRVVKGCSYLHSVNQCHTYNHADIYPSAPGAGKEYLGFRMAFGPISKPTWVNDENSFSEIAPPILETNQNEVLDFFNTTDVQLCFVQKNSNTLFCKDFSGRNRDIQIMGESPIYHPALSPDGKWVIWSTVFEGQNTQGELKLASLEKFDSVVTLGKGVIPRWTIQNKDTFVVYSTSAMANSDSLLWLEQTTRIRKFSNGFWAGAAVKLANGSFTGGVSEDQKLLVSGYTQLRFLNRRNLSTHFQYPENGKSKNSSNQVCNTSVSPRTPTQVSFLDFGATQSSITNTDYGSHEVLFFSNENGKIHNYISYPGTEVWDHVEWSDHNNFMVHAPKNTRETHPRIEALAINQKNLLTLFSGENLWHPTLRVGSSLGFSSFNDSLGYWSYPDNNDFRRWMAWKTRLTMLNRESIQGLVLGSSRPMCGIYSMNISPLTINAAWSGNNLHGVDYFYKNYVQTHVPNLEFIILGVDLFWFRTDSTEFEQIISTSKGFEYDRKNSFWKDSLPSDFHEKLLKAPFVSLNHITNLNGDEVIMSDTGWGEAELYPGATSAYREVNIRSNLKKLSTLLELINQNEIPTILVIFPLNPDYKNTEIYGPYGPDQNNAQSILYQLDSLTKNLSFVDYLDENSFGEHDYTAEQFRDPDHLNLDGADVLTSRVIKRLQKFGLDVKYAPFN